MTCSNSSPSPRAQLGEHCGGLGAPWCFLHALRRASMKAGRLACTLDSLVRVSRRVGNQALTPHKEAGRILPPLRARRRSPDGSDRQCPRARKPKDPKTAFPAEPRRSRVVLSAVWQGATLPTPFYEPGCPVHVRRISCSFSSSDEVLFSFPLRYLFAIGYHAFIFSLGWPAPPIFSQHFQASLLTGTPLQVELTGRV